ncbi:MAG: sigma-70 family polymerase sigma factor, partial [Flaviaesturariibacter sp.]|nr:sigma-70 family polymerase sigma factor [Flaviaesturariibacter sp.]
MKAETNEKGLLQGLAKNDRKAIETIYKENYNVVQALVVNNSGTTDDAKDIFQEALIVLYEKVKTGSFELNCQIKTYVYSVSRRLWLKRLMYQNRFSIGEADEETVAVEEDV